jgi:hypothetical protein
MADEPDLGLALEQVTRQLGRARKYLALTVLATAVAVIVLALDYMIKQAIMRQISQADRTIAQTGGGPDAHAQPSGFPPRGGDTSPDSPPVGRLGMVAGSPLAEGTPEPGSPAPGALSARRGGPPPSTDGDGRRAEGGPAGNGGVAVPPDIAAHPPE